MQVRELEIRLTRTRTHAPLLLVARTFKVTKPSGSTVYRITVPAEIARLLEGVDLVPELTEEGLLFRPATPEERQQSLSPPKWVQRSLESGEGAGAGADVPGKATS